MAPHDPEPGRPRWFISPVRVWPLYTVIAVVGIVVAVCLRSPVPLPVVFLGLIVTAMGWPRRRRR